MKPDGWLESAEEAENLGVQLVAEGRLTKATDKLCSGRPSGRPGHYINEPLCLGMEMWGIELLHNSDFVCRGR